MQTTWIVAADSSRARIFELHGMDEDFHEIEDFANPQGRSENRELRSDSYGRFFGKGERQQGHSVPPNTLPVEHETELFSKTVSAYLDKAHVEHRFDKLRLIAPPKFLGLIRENLSKEAQQLVEEELAKDVSWFDPKEIEAYIQQHRKH